MLTELTPVSNLFNDLIGNDHDEPIKKQEVPN